MELLEGTLKLDTFLTVTLGIVVLFIGKQLNQVVPAFREFSIPEPVTGGLLVCILFTLIYAVTGVGVEFNLGARDVLLVYFFTTIGINASFSDLLGGGKPLVILLAATVVFMVLQNFTGIDVASAWARACSRALRWHCVTDWRSRYLDCLGASLRGKIRHQWRGRNRYCLRDLWAGAGESHGWPDRQVPDQPT